MDSTAMIRELNDAFRIAPSGFGHVDVTKGIAAMPPEQQSEIMRLVHGFDTFTPDNDPYGEHDFDSFEYADKTVKSKNGEPVVNRVLTIMLASEY